MHWRVAAATCLGFTLFFGPFHLSAAASGSYIARPPQPSLIETERYELGKALFLGRLQPSPSSNGQGDAQLVRLQALQDRLPAKVRQSTDLTRLAGSLSAAQVSALEYYLRVRFKIQ